MSANVSFQAMFYNSMSPLPISKSVCVIPFWKTTFFYLEPKLLVKIKNHNIGLLTLLKQNVHVGSKDEFKELVSKYSVKQVSFQKASQRVHYWVHEQSTTLYNSIHSTSIYK